MDQAVYASTANVIIGIRGNRLFQCNAVTGTIQLLADIGTFGRNGCLAYDLGTNKIFCAVWNTPHYDLALSGGFTVPVSNRSLYRVNPSTLAVELTADITTTFSLQSIGGNLNDGAYQEAGICAMDSAGGNIYCRWWGCFITGGLQGGTLRFSAANIATFHNASEGLVGGYPNIVFGSIGGNANAIGPSQEGTPEVFMSDYVLNSTNTFSVASPKNILAVGFAPTQQHVFVTDVAQFIYVYSTAGALVTTLNTLRSSFNGLAVRYNSNDGNIYVAGGNDNTVCQINPATNGFTILTGFDCCVDFVFAGAVRMAVQAGATPLRPF